MSTGIALTALSPASGSLPRASAAGPQGSVPAGLPSHVMLGLQNAPNESNWISSTGAQWDARYQYLTGGVNTGHSWSTWNSPAGAFALMYMRASGAAGTLPVFSYYQIQQSLPSSGASEADRDFNNLNNASTMSAYFADFTQLLDQARAYGKPVVIQIEPDLWGFLEQKAGGCGRASCLSAAVASSGNSAVSAYPNTVQGFAESLLHLRDLYAPNVIMALHASCWGSSFDVCNRPASLSDTATHANQDGAFLASAGITGNQSGTSTWDLIFADPSDRDAGYYQAAYGDSSHWWDPTDSALPNFANFRTWLAGINAATGRRLVLWQIPLGNQYFTTNNNTNGHYQDNRAEYFLGDGPSYSHLQSFTAAGVVGLLFGRGANGTTANTDAQGDGVTNPAPVSGFHCNQCNTHTSSVSDDDGGYLRQFGSAYLNAGGVSLNATPTPTPTVSVTVTSPSGTMTVQRGQSATLAATVTSNVPISGSLVDFEVYSPSGTRVFQSVVSPVALSAGVAQTVRTNWPVATSLSSGTYTVKTGVFASGWSKLYVWNDHLVSAQVN